MTTPSPPALEQRPRKTLCTITDAEDEHDILCDNMPFANPGRGEYGTYFIVYSRRLWVVEKMLERMFIGDPPPLYDRILDFSKAITGVVFSRPQASSLRSGAIGSLPPLRNVHGRIRHQNLTEIALGADAAQFVDPFS